jgi:signal transduction histidine kinase
MNSVLHSFWRRGGIVLATSLVAGLLQALGRPDGRWDAQFVYSVASGLCIWLLLEALRWALKTPKDRILPRGPAAGLGLLACMGLGWVLGTWIGDAYLGKSTWELAQREPQRIVQFVGVGMVATLGVLAWFAHQLRQAQLEGAQLRQAQLELALQASQRHASEAQLQLLRSQLEPHMLFNTLANLRALIEVDPPRALEMLDRFNTWLRSSLQASRRADAEGTLAEEFARLDDYLALMAVRFGPRLRHRLSFDPSMSNAALPALLLQPLVENAIVHGLEPMAQGGQLSVRAWTEGDMLHCEVMDDGVGLSPRHREGLGLSHVRQRLASLFGEAAGLAIGPCAPPCTGTRVHLWWPLRGVA